MTTPAAEMADRHAQVLAELTELGLALGRDLQARALAADEDATAAALAQAFHTVARGVRQTVALAARLDREAARRLREQAQDEQRARQVRARARRDQLRLAVTGDIWREAEGEDAREALLDDLDDLLDDEMASDGFAEAPIARQIGQIRTVLGLTPARAPTGTCAAGMTPAATPGGGPPPAWPPPQPS